MEYNKSIRDMAPGDKVEGFYLLKEAYQKVSSNGKPFLSAVIADKTGTIDVKVWDYSGPVGAQEDIGRIIKIRGDVSEFKGSPQLSLSHVRMALPEDNCDTSRLVAVAPIDRDQTLEDVRAGIASMDDPDYRRVAQTMLDRHLEAFRSIPAAKSVHHSFLSAFI